MDPRLQLLLPSTALASLSFMCTGVSPALTAGRHGTRRSTLAAPTGHYTLPTVTTLAHQASPAGLAYNRTGTTSQLMFSCKIKYSLRIRLLVTIDLTVPTLTFRFFLFFFTPCKRCFYSMLRNIYYLTLSGGA